eukprot:m51a1_g1183 hypothetical protein (254) ;mRNA; f:391682-392805
MNKSTLLCLLALVFAARAVTYRKAVDIPSAGTIVTTNVWTRLDAVTLSFNLQLPRFAVLQFDVGCGIAGAASHMVTHLQVDGQVLPGSTVLIGDVSWHTNTASVPIELAAGNHVIELWYRTPSVGTKRAVLHEEIVRVKGDISKEKHEKARTEEAARTLKEGNDKLAEVAGVMAWDLEWLRRLIRENDEELEMMELAIAAHLDHLRWNRRQLEIEAATLCAILRVVESDERVFLVWRRRALVFAIEWLADRLE